MNLVLDWVAETLLDPVFALIAYWQTLAEIERRIGNQAEREAMMPSVRSILKLHFFKGELRHLLKKEGGHIRLCAVGERDLVFCQCGLTWRHNHTTLSPADIVGVVAKFQERQRLGTLTTIAVMLHTAILERKGLER